MKNVSILFFGLILAVIFSSCEKLEYVEPNDGDSSGITLKSSSTATSVEGDTISIEVQRTGVFKVAYTFTATTATVTFADNSVIQLTGDGYFEKKFTQVGFTWLKVTAIDDLNQVHERTYQVKVVVLFNDPVKFLSVTPVVGSNFFKVRIALTKNGMILGSYPYAYTGSVTNPLWSTVYFAAADTNYRIENNVAYPMPVGQTGSWISTELTLLPGDYEMGVGKMVNNQLVWGEFMGSYFVSPSNTTMIHFTLLPNGTIAGNTSGLLMPGSIGDAGNSPVVRFSENSNGSWTMFLNNGADFSSLPGPFIKTLLSTELWGVPMAQSYVDGFDNWGQILISTPIPETIMFQFGSNIQAPDYINPNMSSSGYYDGRYGYLAVSFTELPVTKANGQKIVLLRPTSVVIK